MTDTAEAFTCLECDTISEDAGDYYDGVECPSCGSDSTAPVRVEPCPLGPDIRTGMNSGPTCPDPSHHYGRGDHVVDLEL